MADCTTAPAKGTYTGKAPGPGKATEIEYSVRIIDEDTAFYEYTKRDPVGSTRWQVDVSYKVEGSGLKMTVTGSRGGPKVGEVIEVAMEGSELVCDGIHCKLLAGIPDFDEMDIPDFDPSA
mmetsp:Transcript_6364/g.13908  ORF Transcript_6364/g.13908 Transcript_6364/m.13908 type:complete len:121 (+) Transcript_6364:69-431(+)